MSSRLSIWGACRTLALRSRPSAQPRLELRRSAGGVLSRPSRRQYSDDATRPPTGPIEAGISKTPDETRTDVQAETSSKQGAQNDDSLSPDDSSQATETVQDSYIDSLDDATLEQLLHGGRTGASAKEGGLTEAQEETLYREGTIPTAAEAEAANAIPPAAEAEAADITDGGGIARPGHKFGLPPTSFPEGYNLKKRYHPVTDQVTKLIMRHGKLGVAQTHMALILNYLRCAPTPTYNPKMSLIPGSPPASHLPLNPVLYLTIAIDSVAPLIKIRSFAGGASGGRALELPAPLNLRQRRRTAVSWILDVVNKKPSRGSGRKQFPHRVAEEIVAVVEGRSGVWQKRRQVHKLATTLRANIGVKPMKHKQV